MKMAKRSISLLFTILLIFTTVLNNQVTVSAGGNKETKVVAETTKTESQKYVEAMSPGWNLGNTLESYDTNKLGADIRETSWGNPKAVQELFDNVKKHGFNSVRIPITFEGCINKDVDGNYIVDQTWLSRIKEVVDMALQSELYVMIEVHGDAWIWMLNWDGNKESEEYIKYCAIWSQLAPVFKDYGDKLCFETLNEPNFTDTEGGLTATEKVDVINETAYNIIRQSGGNNVTRMIVLPSLHTNHEKDVPLYDLIKKLNDPNIIATMHYYSEWVFSANLGITGFDEKLWDDEKYDFEYTARTAINVAFDRMYNQFTANGIGVLIGEYGLLGYDSASECNQPGEELKYYEYINNYAREKGITLMFWDNGSGINRNDQNGATWKKPTVGEWITASMTGRSSTATGLDTIYLNKKDKADEETGQYYDVSPIQIPLTLNGNTLVSIADQSKTLVLGEDYTYDEINATVTLASSYVQAAISSTSDNTYGTCAVLTFKFSSGADWYQYLVKATDIQISGVSEVKKPEYTDDTYDELTEQQKLDLKTTIKLNVDYNGNKIRRMTAFQVDGNRVGPNAGWWKYLQYAGVYIADYEDNSIRIFDSFFADSSVPKTGSIAFRIELYNGNVITYVVSSTEDGYTGNVLEEKQGQSLPSNVLIYAGEGKIPASYLENIIEPSLPYLMVYGWGDTNGAFEIDYTGTCIDYWMYPITISSIAKDSCGVFNGRIKQYGVDVWNYDINIWVKDAPVVHDTVVYDDEQPVINIDNLIAAANPVITYDIEDTSIATVSTDGVVTGITPGTTSVMVTITQYGRTDSYTAKIDVRKCTYLEKSKYTFYVGESDTFTINNLGEGTFQAKSSDSSVVKVEGNQLIATGIGTATVTVNFNVSGGAGKDTIYVVVKDIPSVDTTDHLYFVGDKDFVNIKHLDSTSKVVVVSDNTKVVSIDEHNILSANAAGTANVTVTIRELGKEYSFKFKVTVKKTPTVDLSSNITMYAGNKETYSVTNLQGGQVSATSSNTQVATVKGNTISAVGVGEAVITVVTTLDGKTFTNTIRVTVKASTIQFIKSADSVNKGKTTTFKALVTGVSGKVTYSSSNKKVATVNPSTGVVKGVKAGTSVITATFDNGSIKLSISKTLKVTVPTTSIKIKTTSANKSTLYMVKGKSYTLGVDIKPLDATSPKTFKSSNTKVATVSNKGKITAKKTGTTKITVTCGTKRATITVRVVSKAVSATKLTVAKTRVTIKKGATYSILPLVSSAKTTDRVTFISSNKKVVTVDKYGSLKAKKAGKAIITVKLGKKIAKVTITVK